MEVKSVLNRSDFFLLWKDNSVGAHFLCSQMNYITDTFLDGTTMKKFLNMFPTSLNCRHNLIYVLFVVAAGILHSKSCVLFQIFFVALLHLSYRQRKFRTLSAIRFSETATRGGGALRPATLLKRDCNTGAFL